MIFFISVAFIIGMLIMGVAGVNMIIENIGMILLVITILLLMFVGLIKWPKGTVIIIGCLIVFTICWLIGINIKEDIERANPELRISIMENDHTFLDSNQEPFIVPGGAVFSVFTHPESDRVICKWYFDGEEHTSSFDRTQAWRPEGSSVIARIKYNDLKGNWWENEEIAKALKAYSKMLTITVSNQNPQAGDTVSLAADIMLDGTKITDLEAAGLRLWWWTDIWDEHHGDGQLDSVYSNYDDNSGLSLSADVMLPNAGIYYICVELKTADDVLLAKEFVQFHVIGGQSAQDTEHVSASYPFQQQYWVIFREASRGDRVEASTVNSTADGLHIVWDRGLYLSSGEGQSECDQYFLTENGQWEKMGSYHTLSDCASEVIASNLNICDTQGNVLIAKSGYDDLDWNALK